MYVAVLINLILAVHSTSAEVVSGVFKVNSQNNLGEVRRQKVLSCAFLCIHNPECAGFLFDAGKNCKNWGNTDINPSTASDLVSYKISRSDGVVTILPENTPTTTVNLQEITTSLGPENYEAVTISNITVNLISKNKSKIQPNWPVIDKCYEYQLPDEIQLCTIDFKFPILTPIHKFIFTSYMCPEDALIIANECVYFLNYLSREMSSSEADQDCKLTGGKFPILSPDEVILVTEKMQSLSLLSIWVETCKYISTMGSSVQNALNCLTDIKEGVACSIPASSLCDTPYNGERKCFKKIQSPLPYLDAKRRCNQLGLRLACITDDEEKEMVAPLLSPVTSVGIGYAFNKVHWIRAFDGSLLSDGAYNQFGTQNWPSNLSGRVWTSIEPSGRWTTKRINEAAEFICHKKEALEINIMEQENIDFEQRLTRNFEDLSNREFYRVTYTNETPNSISVFQINYKKAEDDIFKTKNVKSCFEMLTKTSIENLAESSIPDVSDG